MNHALLTVDLGFGDAGKGSIVDFLTRTYDAHTVVRYNGGAQAGHRVVTADTQPREHVFAQFGSGTLAGAATHLSRCMLVDPFAMIEEEKHLRMVGIPDAFARTTIDQQALIITPFQRAINRLKELVRGANRHGSCGMGIGETMADALAHGEKVLTIGDLHDPDTLYAKLDFVRTINLAKLESFQDAVPDTEQAACELEYLSDRDWADWLISAYRDFAAQTQIVPDTYLHSLLQQPGTVIFEGAQGVLLDEWYGFHPHTTWSTTTLANAHQLLAEARFSADISRIGITRAYTTRHGAGPIVTEDPHLTRVLPDVCNSFGAWQHSFRVGWLDLMLLRYALEVVGPLDYLAVTCLDRLAELPTINVCHRYLQNSTSWSRIERAPSRSLAYQEAITQRLKESQPVLEPVSDTSMLLELIAAELDTPVGLISTGPTTDDKQLLLEMSAQLGV